MADWMERDPEECAMCNCEALSARKPWSQAKPSRDLMCCKGVRDWGRERGEKLEAVGKAKKAQKWRRRGGAFRSGPYITRVVTIVVTLVVTISSYYIEYCVDIHNAGCTSRFLSE